jgi:hypothetical protein
MELFRVIFFFSLLSPLLLHCHRRANSFLNTTAHKHHILIRCSLALLLIIYREMGIRDGRLQSNRAIEIIFVWDNFLINEWELHFAVVGMNEGCANVCNFFSLSHFGVCREINFCVWVWGIFGRWTISDVKKMNLTRLFSMELKLAVVWF